MDQEPEGVDAYEDDSVSIDVLEESVRNGFASILEILESMQHTLQQLQQLANCYTTDMSVPTSQREPTGVKELEIPSFARESSLSQDSEIQSQTQGSMSEWQF